ncbi:hypothetical protein BDF19DRAFT_154343 [Syncephalis fuscata]|nr:hypothetical protein BDF19DRAFT_154343 [Syncephalis fuscata]
MPPPQNGNTNLYPLDGYEFLMAFSTNFKEMQAELTYIYIRLLVHVIMSCVQLRNINVALRLVIAQPRALARWCCLIPSVLCISASILIITFNMAKVLRAYMMTQKSRWVLVIGTLLIAVQIVTPAVMFATQVTINTAFYRRGLMGYPPYFVLFWFSASLIVNVFFSSVFSYMAYKQYRTFGSRIWKHLASDGIQSMCLVMLCNVIWTAILVFGISKNFSTLSYFIDCSICSTILIENCRRTRDILSELIVQKLRKYSCFTNTITNIWRDECCHNQLTVDAAS